MKKLFCITLLSLWALSSYAQKNDLAKYSTMLKKYMNKPKNQNETAKSRAAAYLQDSVKLFFFEETGDSSLLLSSKFQYNPNGTVKVNESFIDFFGLFISYGRSNFFYHPTKNRQLVYGDNYISEDEGKTYVKASVDSSFYDSKDRIVLERTRGVELNTVERYSTYQYKTNFNTEDTLRRYELNDMGDALIIYEEEANKFDAKGNVIEKITKSIDFSTDEFGLDSRITSKYNAQNQLTEELTEVWVSNAAPQPEFRKRSLLTYKYNAKGAIAYSINYQDWNTVVWEAKDSTHIQYNAAGKEIGSITYTFDEDEKKYFLDAKNIKLFDKDGNVSFDKNYEVVDSGTLLSSSLALSWWSLYKDAVAANDIFSTDYQLITANPMQDGQAVTVATKHEGTYQLVAFDITGKIVSRQTVTNNQTVSANLPNTGNYLLILMDKKDKPLAMKKVVKM